MYEELKKPIRTFLTNEKGSSLAIRGYVYPSDGSLEVESIEVDGNEWHEESLHPRNDLTKEVAEIKTLTELKESIADAVNNGYPTNAKSFDAYEEYSAINVTLTALLQEDGNIDLDLDRENSFTDYDDSYESNDEDIVLPEQFQGILDDGEETELGEYSGSGDSGDYNISDSAENIREKFMIGARKQFPNIKEQSVFYQMYRDFNEWLTNETEEFVERTPTDFNNEGCFGTVQGTFGTNIVNMTTDVNMGFTNSDSEGSIKEII